MRRAEAFIAVKSPQKPRRTTECAEKSERSRDRLPLVGVVTKPPQMPVTKAGSSGQAALAWKAFVAAPWTFETVGPLASCLPNLAGSGADLWPRSPPLFDAGKRFARPKTPLRNPTNRFFDSATDPNYFEPHNSFGGSIPPLCALLLGVSIGYIGLLVLAPSFRWIISLHEARRRIHGSSLIPPAGDLWLFLSPDRGGSQGGAVLVPQPWDRAADESLKRWQRPACDQSRNPPECRILSHTA